MSVTQEGMLNLFVILKIKFLKTKVKSIPNFYTGDSMQHFDNLNHYCEEDFDEYVYYSRNNKKHRYEEELKQFYFTYEDYHGYEQELFTTIDCIWKVVPPDPMTWASDIDFYGYSELTAWKVISVENAQGDEVEPEEVLTDNQLEDYNAAMLNFIEE